jgi:hypothetical protein
MMAKAGDMTLKLTAWPNPLSVGTSQPGKLRTLIAAGVLAAIAGPAPAATPVASQAGFGADPLDLPTDAPQPDNPWLREPAGRLSGAFAKGVAQRYSDARAVSAIADLKREGVVCSVNTDTTQTGGDVASQGFTCNRTLAAHGCTLTWTVRLQTFRGEMRQTAARFGRTCKRR